MRRSAQWYQEQTERGARELRQLLDESAASRTPAARIYPNLVRNSQRVPNREPQAAQGSTVASRLYPNLKER